MCNGYKQNEFPNFLFEGCQLRQPFPLDSQQICVINFGIFEMFTLVDL